MKTIQAVSAPRLNQVPSQKRAPLPAQEAKEKREESQATQAAIDAEVGELHIIKFFQVSFRRHVASGFHDLRDH
jgi:hypothetical protein